MLIPFFSRFLDRLATEELIPLWDRPTLPSFGLCSLRRGTPRLDSTLCWPLVRGPELDRWRVSGEEGGREAVGGWWENGDLPIMGGLMPLG